MARFYTLSPSITPGAPSKTVPGDQGIAVAVGPVTVPDYLDRPQILTRLGPSEHRLAEFQRWAGSLEEDISRVLAENLSALLSQNNVTVLRWGRGAYPSSVEYRVGVDVTRFEGTIGESVTLAARWYVFGEKEKKILSARESIVKERVAGQDYNALVEAMSRALATLSREIAAAIPVQ
jgi:uncharacterized lipoprotein YmbA